MLSFIECDILLVDNRNRVNGFLHFYEICLEPPSCPLDFHDGHGAVRTRTFFLHPPDSPASVGLASMNAALPVCFSIILLFSHALSGSATAAEGALRASASRADITPDPHMLNWAGKKTYETVLDPLFVRVLVLDEGTNRVAILSWDLVDASEQSVARVRTTISQSTGIPKAHILINASHSHSAPFSSKYGTRMLEEEHTDVDAVEQDPIYQKWAAELPERCVQAVSQANSTLREATFSISRANVPEVLFNRRPRKPDGTVETIFEPADPVTLPNGLQFGPVNSMLSVLSMRDGKGGTIATLFHLPCHSVSIYSYYQGVSADWSGPVATRIAAASGGEAMFLQGCAGDIVPARRGVQARDSMSRLVADRALTAAKKGLVLEAGHLRVSHASLGLPLTEKASRELGTDTVQSEVQVITFGTLALVALPGEPLTDVGTAIQQRSPFPHTLVLGYSNGEGVRYVGMPGEKRRGGYEMGVSAAGTDECGLLLVETAVRLLKEHQTKSANP